MIDFSDIAIHLAQSELADYTSKSISSLESEILFSIACEKDKIKRDKQKILKLESIVVITNGSNLGNISQSNGYGPLNTLSTDLIKNNTNDQTLIQKLDNALIITTSNLLAEIGIKRLGELYIKLPRSLFSIHDYDNHHWISNNIQAAIFADIYFPAHQDSFDLASRVNPNVIGGVPCGTNNWSIDFIKKHFTKMGSLNRNRIPLGKYYIYDQFIHRNKTISTLGQTYPSIGFITTDFHNLSQQEKWDEWTSYALHWIIPVLNDLPIRFFDALITGGIPLIPTGLKSTIKSLGIPENFYVEYGPLDILDPKKVVQQANDFFDEEGLEGMVERHQFCLEHFHVDAVLEQIIASSYRTYKI